MCCAAVSHSLLSPQRRILIAPLIGQARCRHVAQRLGGAPTRPPRACPAARSLHLHVGVPFRYPAVVGGYVVGQALARETAKSFMRLGAG
jgi:hypothetical protein